MNQNPKQKECRILIAIADGNIKEQTSLLKLNSNLLNKSRNVCSIFGNGYYLVKKRSFEQLILKSQGPPECSGFKYQTKQKKILLRKSI